MLPQRMCKDMSPELSRLKKAMERSIDNYLAESSYIVGLKHHTDSAEVLDLEYLHRQTLYTFSEFKNAIIKYCNELESRQS